MHYELFVRLPFAGNRAKCDKCKSSRPYRHELIEVNKRGKQDGVMGNTNSISYDMRRSAVTARLAQSEDVAALVVEAERAALAEVEQYRLKISDLVAASRLRAELLHQRTGARIERLRERMAAAAQLRRAQMDGEMETLAGEHDTDVSTLARLDTAIARVAEELAGFQESG